jgi:hypothetical protein
MRDLKQLALRLTRACERLYTERTLLESMMIGAKVPGWKAMYESLVNDPKARAEIRRQFQPIYDSIEREADEDKVIQELLKVFPANKDVN